MADREHESKIRWAEAFADSVVEARALKGEAPSEMPREEMVDSAYHAQPAILRDEAWADHWAEERKEARHG